MFEPVARYGYYIKQKRVVRRIFLFKISYCRLCDFLLFAFGNRGDSTAESIRGALFYLYKYKRALFLRYYVHFAQGAEVIPSYDFIAVVLKIFRGAVFGFVALPAQKTKHFCSPQTARRTSIAKAQKSFCAEGRDRTLLWKLYGFLCRSLYAPQNRRGGTFRPKYP